MQYEDFEIEIRAGSDNLYHVSIQSIAGDTKAAVRLPVDMLTLEKHLQSLEIAILRSHGTRRRISSTESQQVQEFGRILFDTLFTDDIRSLYDVSQRQAMQNDRGLRIKLYIDAPELAILPWEFLYDPREGEYTALSRATPIVRYLDLPQPTRPLTVQPPLRILAMVANPKNLSLLDVSREKARLERSVAKLRQERLVELTWLKGQTWRDLQEAMLDGPWHIFHFIGHGGFDKILDEGLIVLSDESGQAQPLTATNLGRLLTDHRSLRLVVLNSCQGGQGSEKDILSSTSAILVRRGIPAVLAMQYEITDDAAIEFSRSFYQSISRGLPIDTAVSEARKSISLAFHDTLEWGIPVLYMRSPNGRLFEIENKGHEHKDHDAKNENEQVKHRDLTRNDRPKDNSKVIVSLAALVLMIVAITFFALSDSAWFGFPASVTDSSPTSTPTETVPIEEATPTAISTEEETKQPTPTVGDITPQPTSTMGSLTTRPTPTATRLTSTVGNLTIRPTPTSAKIQGLIAIDQVDTVEAVNTGLLFTTDLASVEEIQSLGGSTSFREDDFVRDGDKVVPIFGTNGQYINFPVTQDGQPNIDLNSGKFSFWYRPNYAFDSTEARHILIMVGKDIYNPPNLRIEVANGRLSFIVEDGKDLYLEATTAYHAPLWQAQEWVEIQAIWNGTGEAEQSDALSLFVNGERVDRGSVVGSWQFEPNKEFSSIFVGSGNAQGHLGANGIIADFQILKHPGN